MMRLEKELRAVQSGEGMLASSLSYFLCRVERRVELVVSGWFHGLPSDVCSCNTSLGLC